MFALKSIFVPRFNKWPSNSMLKKYIEEFEALHGIPFVVGAIDGLNILIIALELHVANFCNMKGFHFVLFHAIMSRKCLV
jgi:hypothetical protein